MEAGSKSEVALVRELRPLATSQARAPRPRKLRPTHEPRKTKTGDPALGSPVLKDRARWLRSVPT